MSGWGYLWRRADARVDQATLRAAAAQLAGRLEIEAEVDDRIRSSRHQDAPWRSTVVFALTRADVPRVVERLEEDPEIGQEDLAESDLAAWRVAVEVFPDVDGVSTYLAFESPLLDNEELSGVGYVLTDALAAAVGATMSGLY